MSRPVFALNEAAAACAVSRSTMRRYRERGRFPDAYKSGDPAIWHIPLDNLLAAGLRLRAPEVSRSEQEQTGALEQQPSMSEQTPEQTVTLPLAEFVRLREAAVRAETLERAMRGLETALRAIEAKPAGNNLVVAADVVDVRTPATGERKAHWWRRTTGVG